MSAPTVVVRYWAGARAAAGVAEEAVRAETAADAIAQVKDLHADNPSFARVVGVCSLLVDGVQARTGADLSNPLKDGSVIEVLPPFAGG